VVGDLNAMHVDTKAHVSGRWSDPWAAGVRVNATIDAPQSEPLLKLAGLDWLPAASNGPGQIKVLIDGPANRDLTLDVRLSTGDFSALALSHGRFSMAQGIAGTGNLQVSPVRQASQPAGAAPLMLSAQYRIAGRSIDVTKFDASLCGSTLRGRL